MRFFFNTASDLPTLKRATPFSTGELRFASVDVLERRLDGSEGRFVEYFFAMYHCSPHEKSGIRDLREDMKIRYPSNVIPIGKQFILCGEPAFKSLAAYYLAMAESDQVDERYKTYYHERLNAVAVKHQRSQSLPVPIDLTEGQLSKDEQLQFYAGMAISSGQIVSESDLLAKP